MRPGRHGTAAWACGALCVLSTPCLFSTPCVAQETPAAYPPCDKQVTEGDTTAAKGAFEAGNAAFNEADYPRAILYWEDAYRRDCTAHALLLNLSRAYELNNQKRHAVGALTTFDARVPNSPKRAQNEKRIKKLQDAIAAEDAAADAAAKEREKQLGSSTPAPTAAPVAQPASPQPTAVEERYTAAHWVSLGGAGIGVALAAIGVPLMLTSNIEGFNRVFDPNGRGNTAAEDIATEWGSAANAQAAIDELYAGMGPDVTAQVGRDALKDDALAAASKFNAGLAMTVTGAAVAVVGTTLFFVLPKERVALDAASIDVVSPTFAPGYAGFAVAGRF